MSSKVKGHPFQIAWGQLKDHTHVYDFLYVFHVKFGHNMPHSEDAAHSKLNYILFDLYKSSKVKGNEVNWNTIYDLLYVFHINFG